MVNPFMGDDFGFFCTLYLQLFAAAAPIPNAILYLGITSEYTAQDRWKIARKGMLIASGILFCTALLGPFILQIIGVEIHAFRIAGGMIISRIAWSMLHSDKDSSNNCTPSLKKDILITPLAFPILAGPGAISATLIGQAEAVTTPQKIELFLAIFLLMLTFYFLFYLVCFFAKYMRPSFVQICTKLFGVLLLALSVQFITTGVLGFLKELH